MSSTFHKCLGLHMQSFLLWSQDHVLPFIPFAYVHPLTCLVNWINLMYTSATVSKNIQCTVSLLQLVRQNVMPRFLWFSSFVGLTEAEGNWHPWGQTWGSLFETHFRCSVMILPQSKKPKSCGINLHTSFSFALQLLLGWYLQVSQVLEAEQVWRLVVALVVVEQDLWA